MSEDYHHHESPRSSKHSSSSRSKKTKKTSTHKSKKTTGSSSSRKTESDSDEEELVKTLTSEKKSVASGSSIAATPLANHHNNKRLFSIEVITQMQTLREYCSQRILRSASHLVNLMQHWLTRIQEQNSKQKQRQTQYECETNIKQLKRMFSIVVGAGFCQAIEQNRTNHSGAASGASGVANGGMSLTIHADIMQSLIAYPELVTLLDYYATVQATLLGTANALVLCLIDPLQYYQDTLARTIHFFEKFQIQGVAAENYEWVLTLTERAVSDKLSILVSFPIEPIFFTALYTEELQKRQLYAMKLPILSSCFQNTDRVKQHLTKLVELGGGGTETKTTDVVDALAFEKLTTVAYHQLQSTQALHSLLTATNKLGVEALEQLKQLRQLASHLLTVKSTPASTLGATSNNSSTPAGNRGPTSRTTTAVVAPSASLATGILLPNNSGLGAGGGVGSGAGTAIKSTSASQQQQPQNIQPQTTTTTQQTTQPQAAAPTPMPSSYSLDHKHSTPSLTTPMPALTPQAFSPNHYLQTFMQHTLLPAVTSSTTTKK